MDLLIFFPTENQKLQRSKEIWEENEMWCERMTQKELASKSCHHLWRWTGQKQARIEGSAPHTHTKLHPHTNSGWARCEQGFCKRRQASFMIQSAETCWTKLKIAKVILLLLKPVVVNRTCSWQGAALFSTFRSFPEYEEFTHVSMGTESEAADREVKFLLQLCTAAFRIEIRRRSNYRTGSCALHFSLVKKGKKQRDSRLCGTLYIPLNLGYFLLQFCAELSLSLHIHSAATCTVVTQANKLP